MLAGLRAGKLQLALMVKPAPAMLRGLHFTDITTDTLRFAVAPKHPLAKKQFVTMAEIAREPLVVYSRSEYPDYHEMLDALFSRTKAKPRIAEEHDGVTSIIAAVESGGGVALLSESVACMAGPRLKLIPIAPAIAPAIIGAAMARAKPESSAEQFLKCAKAVASKAG
jgi:DNA-binding transcriptional LysR family regulator